MGFGTSWSPISDKFNEWVKVDEVNVCVLWGGMHPDPPDWGTEGGQETITTNLLCCIDKEGGEPSLDVQDSETPASPKPEAATTKATPAATTPVATTQATPKPAPVVTEETEAISVLVSHTLEETQEKYQARWHDRSKGWKGQTYSEAIRFCADNGSYIPCPYEAYCPMVRFYAISLLVFFCCFNSLFIFWMQGPGKHIVGGMRSTQSWAPMIDVPNGWISVGPENTCMPYNNFNAAPPDWGLTGENNEEITR